MTLRSCTCRLGKLRVLLGLCLALPYVIILICIQFLTMPPDGATNQRGHDPVLEPLGPEEYHGVGLPIGASHRALQGLQQAYAARITRRKGLQLHHLRPDCKPLMLTNATTTSLTAIASFPGSGNTWLRHLIQQATGYYTGSLYNDRMLKKRGFLAEGVGNSSVIAVKTHEWPGKDKHGTKFQRAILLLRDPYQSLVAEFNRRHGGHMGFAKHSRESSNHDFHSYTVDMSKAWLEFNVRWLNFDGPLHVVLYEDISSNLNQVIHDVCKFLGVSLSRDTIKCVKANSEGNFHRGASSSSRDSMWAEFGDDVKDMIDSYTRDIASSLALRPH